MTEVKAGPRHAGLLALVLVVAGVAYGWRAQSVPLEPYYAAAVRAMASSWHDFAFGAFDPAGTVTLDKLPGAFWIAQHCKPLPDTAPPFHGFYCTPADAAP
jgi:4-amino-4-deoxy-L-arabinose transferase-like glycosyltransferase